MSRAVGGRRAGVLAMVAGLALASAGLSGTATALTTHGPGPRSTPVELKTPDGVISSYVLNVAKANRGQTRQVEMAVTRAGGVVVQSWPEIGVVVAHSDRAAFRTDVRKEAGKKLASVGATRSVAVSEGSPAGLRTSWGTGKAQGKSARASGTTKGSGNGDTTGTEATEAVVADPRESEQWDKRMIKADLAHRVTDGSDRVLVGVLDSGIQGDHPDLAANIDTRRSVNCSNAGRPDTSATGWYPTTSDHGTHVAGIIASPRNGVGIVGVAPGVKMASVKVVNDDGFIYPEYAVCGFMWAGQHDMDVTNNSYYVDPFEFWCGDQPDQAAAKEAVRRAVSWSSDRGVAHVAAAGNSSYDLSNKTTNDTSPNDAETPVDRVINQGCHDIPAELSGVVTVSAVTRVATDSLEPRLASFSNRGRGVIDVGAPGQSILSTVTGSKYGLKSGTSMASPQVAGVLALMKSAHPRWSGKKLVKNLLAQADNTACGPNTAVGAPCVGGARNNSYFGEGLVDALDAVR